MNISNILMGVQVVLAIVLILSIMPQDTKSAVPSQYGGEGNQSYFKPKGKEAFLRKSNKNSCSIILYKCNSYAFS